MKRLILSKKKSAFTLPEVIISISVIVMVITASTNILVSVIRSNADNIETLVAYGLAQEGLEAVRNIRDSNWVLGLPFHGARPSQSGQGGQSGQNGSIWGDFLFDENQTIAKKYFTVHRKAGNELQSCNDQQIEACAPWQIIALNSSRDITLDEANKIQLDGFGSDESKLSVYKNISANDANNIVDKSLLYNQFSGATFPERFEESQFKRFIQVEKVCFSKLEGPNCEAGENENSKLRVSSVVVWVASNGLKNQVILTSELTNWKR